MRDAGFTDGVAGAGRAMAGAAATTMKKSPTIERIIAWTSFAASMDYGKAGVAWAFLDEFEFRRTGRSGCVSAALVDLVGLYTGWFGWEGIRHGYQDRAGASTSASPT